MDHSPGSPPQPAPLSGSADTRGRALVALPILAAVLNGLASRLLPALDCDRRAYEMVTVLADLPVGVAFLLAALDAKQLGFGTTNEEETGPLGWFWLVVLFWPVTLPLYLYKRAKHGAKNLLVGGLLGVALAIGAGLYRGSVWRSLSCGSPEGIRAGARLVPSAPSQALC